MRRAYTGSRCRSRRVAFSRGADCVRGGALELGGDLVGELRVGVGALAHRGRCPLMKRH